MLQNFKSIFPWILSGILLIILIWKLTPKKAYKSESTIETETRVEESLVDSFYVEREIIRSQRDSVLWGLDTMNAEQVKSILDENIKWYLENYLQSSSSSSSAMGGEKKQP